MLHPKRNFFFALLFGLVGSSLRCLLVKHVTACLCSLLLLTFAPLLCVGYLFLLSDEGCNGISHASGSSAEVTNIFLLFYRFIAQDINALKGVSVYATGWFLKCPPASVASARLQESLNDEIV